MKQFRMIEETLSNGDVVYGIQKKGWFGWRRVTFPSFGKYITHHHDRRIVEMHMESMQERSAHVVSSKIIGD